MAVWSRRICDAQSQARHGLFARHLFDNGASSATAQPIPPIFCAKPHALTNSKIHRRGERLATAHGSQKVPKAGVGAKKMDPPIRDIIDESRSLAPRVRVRCLAVCIARRWASRAAESGLLPEEARALWRGAQGRSTPANRPGEHPLCVLSMTAPDLCRYGCRVLRFGAPTRPLPTYRRMAVELLAIGASTR